MREVFTFLQHSKRLNLLGKDLSKIVSCFRVKNAPFIICCEFSENMLIRKVLHAQSAFATAT